MPWMAQEHKKARDIRDKIGKFLGSSPTEKTKSENNFKEASTPLDFRFTSDSNSDITFKKLAEAPETKRRSHE